ncbi:GTPase [Stenotrophomonas maltophilia]|uniref:GTPase n=1 Tax=Stenotrophomonas maltophilia TaxID=40324 RepID=UPI0039C40F86
MQDFSGAGGAELQLHLAAAADAAKRSIAGVRPEHEAFTAVLRRFEGDIATAEVGTPSGASRQINEAISGFQIRYSALQKMISDMVKRTTRDLGSAFADLERDSDLVTIMLFGRTRAGKSTTMEALTGGDGASIGYGRQHSTTDIRAYHLPRTENGEPLPGPGLRIVDTPGIEGFEGNALAAMAEAYVERCDHILFLLTDDKATADELDRFGLIKTQAKGVTVLLNVKAADEDLDLLVSAPEMIFREQDLRGHSQRICKYLSQHFEMQAPRIIPLHARAAWLGRGGGELPDSVTSRSALFQQSRLAEVEARIGEFIRDHALPARLAAPRDLLLGHLYPLKHELRQFAYDFHRVMGDVEKIARHIQRGTEHARVRISRRFPQLRMRFQQASDALPGIVDSVIADGGRGAALNSSWKQLLQTHGVADAAAWFVAEGRKDFTAEITEEVRTAAFDHQFSDAQEFEGLFDDYHEADAKSGRNRSVRAGIRVAGGASAAMLAGWAVTNFWNPTGWAAAGAAVLVAGVGFAGEAVARKVTDSLERSSRQELYQKRGQIIAQLRDRLWDDFRAVNTHCGTWLDETKALHLRVANDIAKPIQQSAKQLWKSTIDCMRGMDAIADRINAGLVTDLFETTVPECAQGKISIDKVVRSIGRRTKVLVSGKEPGRSNAIGACVGRKGARIQKIRIALGNEQVDLVDAQAPMEQQVLQALGLAIASEVSITLVSLHGREAAHVRMSAQAQAAASARLSGTNVRLASNLLGLDIVIERGKQ